MMNTENMSMIISCVAAIAAIIFGYIAFKQSDKRETSVEASKMTTVLVKLENISAGITEIKSEMNTMKTDQKVDHDKIIEIDQSLKQAWHKIDTLQEALEKK